MFFAWDRRGIVDALFMASLADELKNKKLRDETLDQIANGAEGNLTVKLARVLSVWLAPGAEQPLDRKAAEAIVTSAGDTLLRGSFDLVMARFLAIHGERDEAIAHYRKAVSNKETAGWYKLIAKAALREAGVKVEDPPSEKPADQNAVKTEKAGS
jgi:hypothetical protein